MHEAGYFVTRNDRGWNVVVLSEIPVNELDVGATHSTRLDLDEHLIWLNVRNWHVLENEAFVVLPDASCLHRCLLLRVSMRSSNAWSCQTLAVSRSRRTHRRSMAGTAPTPSCILQEFDHLFGNGFGRSRILPGDQIPVGNAERLPGYGLVEDRALFPERRL